MKTSGQGAGWELFQSEVAGFVDSTSPKRLDVVRKECGCRIGIVFDGTAGYVLVGERRRWATVDLDLNMEIKSAPFYCLLEPLPDLPEDYGCKHSVGHWLPLAEILEAARTTTRRRKFRVT